MMPEYRQDALVQLCHALLPEDPSLAAEVALADRDAYAYYAQFWERLRHDRGMEPHDVAFPELPWMALFDGLRYRQRLEEVDWRALAELVMEVIDKLLHDEATVAQRWAWVDLEHWDRVPTWEFLQAIGDRLLQQGRMLAQCYDDSDSYPIIIIDPGQLPELQRLARLSGYGDIQPLAFTLPQHFQLPWWSET